MKDNEKVYQEQIAPLIDKIGDICEKHGISFIANVSLSIGEGNYVGYSSSYFSDDVHPRLRVADLIASGEIGPSELAGEIVNFIFGKLVKESDHSEAK